MRRAAWLAVPALLACQTPLDDLDTGLGAAVTVEVLDEGFVRFEDRRMALEFFLLEMRERVRAADGDLDRTPRVTVHVADGATGVDGRWISALSTELHKAGVRYVTLEGS